MNIKKEIKVNKIISILIILLWSSSIFEQGLTFFRDYLGLTLFMLTSIVFIIVSFMIIFKDDIVIKIEKPLILLIFLYIIYWAYSWFGNLYTVDQISGISKVITYSWYTFLSIITIIMLASYSYYDKRKVFKSIGMVSIGVMFLFLLYIIITGESIVESHTEIGRFSLTLFLDYNIYAHALFFSALLMFIPKDKKNEEVTVKTFLTYFLIILLVTGLGILSSSRRSITLFAPISLIVPTLLILMKNPKILIKSVSIIIPIGTLIYVFFKITSEKIHGVLSGNFIFQQLESNLERATSFFEGDLSTGRTGIWELGLSTLREYNLTEILFGRGTSSYKDLPGLVDAYYTPHNFILSSILEGGIVKLMIILLILFIWFSYLYIKRNNFDFWTYNFLLVSTCLACAIALISGQDFFISRTTLLIFIVFITLYKGNDYEKNYN